MRDRGNDAECTSLPRHDIKMMPPEERRGADSVLGRSFLSIVPGYMGE